MTGWTAAAYPTALAAATLLHYAVRGRSLPDELPSRWALDGTPVAWTSTARAATTDIAMTVVPATAAVWAAASGRRGASRVGLLAAASAIATVGAVTTVIRPLAGPRRERVCDPKP